jgi:adenine deaminase
MAKAGMTPSAVIASATSVAARVLGLEREVGQIALGLAADLVAVAGNPIDRLQALDDVRMVMARGRVLLDRLDQQRAMPARKFLTSPIDKANICLCGGRPSQAKSS